MMICEDFCRWNILCLGDEIFLIVFFPSVVCSQIFDLWLLRWWDERGPMSYANNNAFEWCSTNRLSGLEKGNWFRVNHLENSSFFLSLLPSFAFHSDKHKRKTKKNSLFFEVKMCKHTREKASILPKMKIWPKTSAFETHTQKKREGKEAHRIGGEKGRKGSWKSNFDSICNKGFTSIYIFSQGAFERSI